MKDSAVDAVCHGAMLAIPGVISLSKGISKGETVVLLTAKGELVGIAEASMSTEEVQEQPRRDRVPGQAGDNGPGDVPQDVEEATERGE